MRMPFVVCNESGGFAASTFCPHVEYTECMQHWTGSSLCLAKCSYVCLKHVYKE